MLILKEIPLKIIDKSEVITAVSTKIAVFCVAAPPSLFEDNRRFEGVCCFHLIALTITAASTSETSVDDQAKSRYNPENSQLHYVLLQLLNFHIPISTGSNISKTSINNRIRTQKTSVLFIYTRYWITFTTFNIDNIHAFVPPVLSTILQGLNFTTRTAVTCL